jgi:cold shock CspA family protein
MDAADVPRGGPVDGRIRGRVERFDEAGGYGVVASGQGAGEWFFHCTAIADGSRTIEVGRAVTFDVVAGHLGRYEATDLRPA